MILFVPYVLALMIIIFTVIEVIRFRKHRKPERIARKFAYAAVAIGILHLVCDFFPFNYNGASGIDYMGQAMVWAYFIDAIIYSTLIVYLNFAIAATIYAVKSLRLKNPKTGKKNAITLIITWICAVLVAGIVIANVVTDKINKKSISVEVKQVTAVKDYEGTPSVLVVFELRNNSKNNISYITSVYDEVYQGEQELNDTIMDDPICDPDNDIKVIGPGESIEIGKVFEQKTVGEPVRIICTSYGRDVTYVDGVYEIK